MSGVGSLLGGGGKNSFKAKQATLDETQYGPYVQNALNQTQAQMAANANGGADLAALAEAIKARSTGQTPSLAQRMLQQGTEANIAQGAGALASVRGINPALAARMIAQNRGAANQAAAGQAATLRLQEQMGAEQELAQAYETKRQQDLAAQQVNAQTVGTLGGLQAGQNQNRIGNVTQANQANASVAAQNAKSGGNVLGGLLGAAGSVLGTMVAPGIGTALGGALGNAVGGGLSGVIGGDHNADQGDTAGGMSYMADGGEIEFARAIHDARSGGRVPGKAQVPGDSPENDTVHTLTSPGEIVLPRSVAQAPDAPKQAAEFVKAIKAKKGDAGGFARVLEAERRLLAAMAEGGEVEDDSWGGRLSRWWHASDDDKAEASKKVEEKAVDSTNGYLKRTTDAIRQNRRALDEAMAEG